MSVNIGIAVGEQGEERRPFWAKCWTCGHIWACAYLPMTMSMVGKTLKHLHCPMCGEDTKKIGFAKQTNGVLEETPQQRKDESAN